MTRDTPVVLLIKPTTMFSSTLPNLRLLTTTRRAVVRAQSQTPHTQCLSNSPLNRPSPPPLPPKEQREFEELVRAAAAPASSADINAEAAALQARISKGEELHPDARKPLQPEFEGDTNPNTGEVGGPKREPLRHGDWSYGGRITDF